MEKLKSKGRIVEEQVAKLKKKLRNCRKSCEVEKKKRKVQEKVAKLKRESRIVEEKVAKLKKKLRN